MNSVNMNSEASKSAITPSFNGRIVFISSCVLPCMCFACSPTAITLFVLLCIATIDGLSTTTLLLCIIKVFAVPKSIAISCVKKSNNPIVDYVSVLLKK